LIKTHPDWGMVLQQRSAQWRRSLLEKGWQGPDGTGPILPLLIGSDQEALDCQHQLERAGLLCMAIRPPTVPEGTARLRLVLRRDLPDDTLNRLIEALPSR
jgi:8-amino-7-oxononanoate synthase